MNDLVAKIFLKGNKVDIADIIFYLRDLRFKCQHCASLCCKLGGPPLSRRDINRIKRAGHDSVEYSESASFKRFKLPKVMQSVMKNREDGSCIFLKNNREEGICECSIYDYRPALCRLYPFYLEMVGSCVLLKVIPCCKGLNDSDGELVDERFVLRHLQKAIIDLLPEHP